MLRTATAGLAARLDFTLDEIEDLRIAVDEACAMLLAAGACPAPTSTASSSSTPTSCGSRVSVLTLDGAEPARDTFAWTVLSALAGEVDSRVDPDGRVTIDLNKRRAAVGSP